MPEAKPRVPCATPVLHTCSQDAGCAWTQCLAGWKESGGTRCLRCPPDGGYRDCGLGYCAKGGSAAACINPLASRVSYESTRHNYTIPDNDAGLL